MKKKALILAAAGMMLAGSLTGCGSLKDDAVVVTVGDKEITGDLANFYARYTQAQYETYYSGYLGENMWTTEAEKGKTYEETVKSSALEDLEKMIVLEEHMSEYEVSISDDEKAAIAKAAKEFDEANTLEGKEKISASEKTAERMLTLMTIQQKMNTAIGNKADAEVSDEEAAQKSMQYVQFAYTKTDEEGNSTDLSEDEKKAAKEQAEAFAEGAKTAADFGAFATGMSLEVQTATFDKEATSPNADLVKEADKLGEGEVTGVIETDSGCYVAKVTGMLDRAATDTKKESIVSERKTKLYDDTCDKWLKKAGVKVDKKEWKKVDFNELSVTMKQGEEEPYTDPVTTDEQVEE